MKKTVEFSAIPGTKGLFLDYLSGKMEAHYRHHFASETGVLEVQKQITARSFPRQEIVEVLLRQNKSYGAGPKTIENINKLTQPTTSAVFTGQQVTLFGGPLFTFYKAALAIKLAESNCKKLKGDVVPIFWLAADDADFAEVAKINLPGKDDRTIELEYRPDREIVEQPMGSVVLDTGILALLKEFETALPETEFRPQLISILRELYQPGVSIVTAFARYLSHLFRDKGLILIDPSDEQFRKLALPIFRQELSLREKAAEVVQQENDSLESLGYHLQVAKPGSYSNLFYYNGRRSKINFVPDGFEIEGEFLSQQQIDDLVQKSPALFSPNVFLRPIVQSHIFPTLIYFAGPAEAAYFGQINRLFDLFREVAPVIYPRFSATIVERNAARIMEKYQLSFEDFTGNIDQLAVSVLKRSFPSDFTLQFSELTEEIKAQLQRIIDKLDQSDHGLLTTASRTAGRLEVELKSLEEKVFQAHKKKNQTVTAQLERAAFLLYPDRKLQERSFPLNYFIAKYGFGIVDFLYQQVDCNSGVHHLISLDDWQGAQS